MALSSVAVTILLSLCLLYNAPAPGGAADLPDLKIRRYEFVSTKGLRVQVTNDGKGASKPCRLELALRKVKGTAVTRSATETVPALEPGKEAWVTFTASGMLEAASSLEDTTFRLTVDETGIVGEADENNNEMWHNSN